MLHIPPTEYSVFKDEAMTRMHLATIVCALCFLMSPSAAISQSYKWTAPEIDVQEFEGAPRDQASRLFGVIPSVSTMQIPLPVPVDPNDMLMQDAFDRSDFGSGYAIATFGDSEDPYAMFRLVPNVNLNTTYNTGNPGDGLSPSTFALQGSNEARASGRFAMDTTAASLKSDVQIPSLTAQIYTEIRATGSGQLDFRQIYGRAGNWLGGSYFSSFADSGTLPQSIVLNAAPAGAIASPSVVQLQYVRLFESGLLVGAAIENPNGSDFTLVNATDVPLLRVPDFVARVRYQPFNTWGSLQGALLLRQFAYEDIGTVEHFSPVAVSFSSNARFKTFGDDNVRLGVVGGQGAGSRIFGLNAAQIAAGPSGTSLVPLQNVGAFASYQHFWTESLWSNVAYGYAYAELSPSMTDLTRRSQNGWVNLIWNDPRGKIALGLEYQVGQQEIGDGRHGLNHCVQLSMQIGKGYSAPEVPSGESATSTERGMRPYSGGGVPSSGDIFPRL
jgi:hypothetical protein